MKKWLPVSIIGFLPIFLMMLVFFLIIGGGGSSASGSVTPVEPTGTQAEFIQRIGEAARHVQKDTNIFPSITIAQAILESGYGQSGLTLKANNLFGIKAGGKWDGPTITMKTQEEVNGGIIVIKAKFRAYNSWEESILDHVNFLEENSTYTKNGVFSAANYVEQAEALRRAGYATDSSYPQKLCDLIEMYNLTQYDYM